MSVPVSQPTGAPDLVAFPDGPAEQAQRDRQTAAALQAAIERRLGRRDRTLSADSAVAALAAELEQRPAGWRQRY